MLTVNHDANNDVLYIGIGDRSNSYGDEIEADIVVLYDMDTEELTGITILDFMQKYKSEQLVKLTKALPVVINFEKDILPQI